MKIRVIAATRADSWYADLVGEIFHVFMIPNVPFAFLSTILYFFPEDVQEVKEGTGCTGSINLIGIA